MARSSAARAEQGARFTLSPLPYPEDALAPVISADTLRLHHGKHHRKYVDTTNALVEEHQVPGATLEEVVRHAAREPKLKKLFNQAAQAWNHDFYWQSLSPQGGRPSGALAAEIDRAFGSYDKFGAQLAALAVAQFASGWAWLVVEGGQLKITTTSNAHTPMVDGATCLLTLDVWEHAYYLDYQNERDRHVKAVIAERLNWQFAAKNFGR